MSRVTLPFRFSAAKTVLLRYKISERSAALDIPDPQLRKPRWGRAGEGGTKARSIISLVLQSGGKRGEGRKEKRRDGITDIPHA